MKTTKKKADLMKFLMREKKMLYKKACGAVLAGIQIRNPERVFIRGELQCGEGVEIDIDVIIEGKVSLGDGVKIGAHSILINSKIGARSMVNPFSIIENAEIGSDTFIGPYGRVRPGSVVGDNAQIGNFVEIKNSEVGARSRINHLSFVGDATLEEDVTIGAGCITCNHNGVDVSRTQIKKGAYIGSGCELVAPLLVGENATIGAGSTVTQDVPAGKLTLARARQVTIDGWAGPQRDRLKK